MTEITGLLEQLAASFGTTIDKLWAILIKQAPISSTIDIIQYMLVGLACWGWWKITKKVSTKMSKGEFEEPHIIYIIVGWIVLVVLVIAALFCMHETINGFVNPEYWALNKILERLSYIRP